jgi:transcriptional regulator GlxA family with amidase domain
MRTVGILMFDGVEELDFVGPMEVFGILNRLHPGSARTVLIGPGRTTVRTAYGLRVESDVGYPDAPSLDLLIVPGGGGVRAAARDPAILEFVRSVRDRGTVVASVCTGALLLAAAGMLDGKHATTHFAALDELAGYPKVVVEHRRFIDLGSVVTSAGISSGLDMSLHLVERFFGAELAEEVAHRMEYTRRAGDEV